MKLAIGVFVGIFIGALMQSSAFVAICEQSHKFRIGGDVFVCRMEPR